MSGKDQSSHERDRDILQSLADRLMRRSTNLTASQSHPATSPSWPGSVSSSSTRSGPTQNENSPPATNLRQTTPRTLSSFECRDVTMMDANAGPSLKGDAAGLAEARAFADKVTRGGNKAHRGVGAIRERVLSSPRSPVVARATQPSGTNDSQKQATQHVPFSLVTSVVAEYTSGGVLALHDRPQMEPAPAAAVSVINANLFGSGTSSTKNESKQSGGKQVENGPGVVVRRQLTHGHPSIPSSVKKHDASNLFQRQSIDLMKTLEACRTEPSPPPPHLRASTIAAGIPDRVQPPHVRAREGNVDGPDKQPAVLSTRRNGVKGSTSNPDRSKAPHDHAAENGVSVSRKEPTTLPASRTVGEEFSGKDAISVTEDANAMTDKTLKTLKEDATEVRPPATPKMAQSAKVIAATEPELPKAQAHLGESAIEDDVCKALQGIKVRLQMIIHSVEYLEKENAATQRQLQTVVQAEERRKFLGTGAAMAPFGLEVKCANGKICNVQVHTELKIYELVRRACTKANLTLTVRSKPRVTVNGNEVGHGMTLGEVGINRDAEAKVELSYDS